MENSAGAESFRRPEESFTTASATDVLRRDSASASSRHSSAAVVSIRRPGSAPCFGCRRNEKPRRNMSPSIYAAHHVPCHGQTNLLLGLAEVVREHSHVPWVVEPGDENREPAEKTADRFLIKVEKEDSSEQEAVGSVHVSDEVSTARKPACRSDWRPPPWLPPSQVVSEDMLGLLKAQPDWATLRPRRTERGVGVEEKETATVLVEPSRFRWKPRWRCATGPEHARSRGCGGHGAAAARALRRTNSAPMSHGMLLGPSACRAVCGS